ncbi:hypothetical protein C8F04DRAFT_1194977 [Mycena alexandri]|uniref:Uncharacterized protein n=1 Tax=Mycena alexandri TaxID=1745969 RepID=A0AAD6S6V0_9AGAR|nr:hypothetical protein C8F04DRAFT_1194977 [Mycena alexandri]
MAVRRGRPSKRGKRNISGLRNQPGNISRAGSSSEANTRSPSPPESVEDFSDSEILDIAELDSITYLEVDSDHDDNSDEADWDEVASEEFQERLLEMIAKMEEDRRDAGDEDWLPPQQLYEAKRKSGGPDTASKSIRTQQRYALSNKTQKKLDGFFSIQASSPSSNHAQAVEIQDSFPEQFETPPPTSVLSDPSDHESVPLIVVDNTEEEEDDHDWDVILDDLVDGGANSTETHTSGNAARPATAPSTSAPGNTVNIRSWHALREKVKGELQQKHLPLTKYNQLLIIRNFATLRIKGLKRIAASLEIARQWHEGSGTHFARRVRALARHYQLFEELPLETRGGRANAKSLLNDESVQTACLAWLTKQTVGSVTPMKFREGVNSEILPSLGISPKQPISERTARRWLVRLGYRRTLIKKDGRAGGSNDQVRKRHLEGC